MKIGLFGGSFDPITNAHLIMAETAREQFKLDYVHFIPTSQNPLKNGIRSNSQRRVDMIKLAIDSNRRFLLDYTDQINRYINSIDTIEHIKKQRTQTIDEYYFIMGSDCLKTFHKWKDWEKILENVTLLIGNRYSGPCECYSLFSDDNRERFENKIKTFDIPFTGISSTDVRNRVKTGKSIKYLVPESVEKYIYDNKLYNQFKVKGETNGTEKV